MGHAELAGKSTRRLTRDAQYLMGFRVKEFDPKDQEEIALVNKRQDQFVSETGSPDPPPPVKWDMDSLKALTSEYENESAKYSRWRGLMGPRGKVDEKKAATSLRQRADPPGRHQGWNSLMRIYLPGKSTLDGSYKLPAAQSTSSCWVSCCHG